MRFLIDNHKTKVARKCRSPLACGQLITPLTGYSNWGGVFAVDNGAFSQFREKKFVSILNRDQKLAAKCLFVACPDVVGDWVQTRERFDQYRSLIPDCYPVAFVAQNEQPLNDVPWNEISCLFIGGKDPWKESNECIELVREAKRRQKFVHVGRVNGAERFLLFDALGADTCDGTGVARYDHMLHKIEAAAGINKTQFDTPQRTRWLF